MGQCLLFLQLHLPKRTSVDLLEFMEGARIATEANLRAMNSAALQQYTTPAYYNQMALRVKKNYLHRNFYVECEGLVVEKPQLAQVVYGRLTEKQYEDWHLRLHVDVATVEVLDVVNLQGKTNCVQHENVYRVVFESRVTDPEEVDWRIEGMHIIEQKAVQRP
ncbi:hypothetical protein PHYSODRAFT_531668 [Phytophthora sojae]|uniref:Tim44-like domain-containing protein n=1 Tax=Phytophthora sojae (strain P6497) TaxID=1094619 RepID=G5AE93_PHYSP|nr:hypothetical protein PHYSODRAFT_531668 [Phytophthora sojae]EGZ06495.1 hypothetical protein PHYSODRAFT_531668 [Phytophthora sojae]|eukprot:XP_009538392.1 hypothetical protein PHYSODRAFT_531668 [Phytophthora sojae]